MTELVELSSSKHRTLRVAHQCSLVLAAKQHVINIRAAEVGMAVSCFPVFFTRNPGTGDWALSAVTSFERGHNLFVEDEQWTATYQPTSMQTYPLFLMNSPAHEGGYTVGIDEKSDAFSEDSGEALFDNNGKASLYLTRLTAMLKVDVQNDIQTRLFARELDELGLHKSIDILVHYDDGSVHTITGLHTLDEDKLQSLTAEQLHELNKKGYLILMHAMLLSVYQLNLLIRKHNRLGRSTNVKQVKLEVSRQKGAA